MRNTKCWCTKPGCARTHTIRDIWPQFFPGGLGLNLAEAILFGVSHATVVSAVNATIIPPAVDLGIVFDMSDDAFQPANLEGHLAHDQEGFVDPLVSRDTPWEFEKFNQVLRLLPLLIGPWSSVSPVGSDVCAHQSHIDAVLDAVFLDPELLNQVDSSPLHLQKRLPFAACVSPIATPVQRANLKGVCRLFPGLQNRLWKAVKDGVGLDQAPLPFIKANETATKLLGIHIDLRHGVLIPCTDVDYICEAVGCDSEVLSVLEVVPPRAAARLGDERLVGACWSHSLNSILNHEPAVGLFIIDGNRKDWLTGRPTH